MYKPECIQTFLNLPPHTSPLHPQQGSNHTSQQHQANQHTQPHRQGLGPFAWGKHPHLGAQCVLCLAGVNLLAGDVNGASDGVRWILRVVFVNSLYQPLG